MWMSLMHELCFADDRIKVGNDEAGTIFSIKLMINYRQIRTRIRQLMYWRWREIILMSRSTSGISSWFYLHPYKIFLTIHRHITLLLSKFILINVFILITGPRILNQMLVRQRQHILLTNSGFYYDSMPNMWENMTAMKRTEIMSFFLCWFLF